MPPAGTRRTAVLQSLESSHLRAIAAIVLLVAMGVAVMLLSILLIDRVRVGLVAGLTAATVLFAFVIFASWRAGIRVFATRVTIAFVALLVIPIAELAAYAAHGRRIDAARAEAISADDRAAMRVHAATPRQSRDGMWKFMPVASPFFTINAEGFRGRLPEAARDSDIRVLMVGGSAVFGTGVADANTLPAMLEARLRNGGLSNVAVLNLGVEAITIQQEAAIVREWLPRVSPAVVVFHDGANDFLLHGWLALRAARDNLFRADTIGARLAGRIEQLALVAALKRAITTATMAPANGSSIVAAARSAYARGRREAEGLCRDAAVRCVFVIQPIIMDRTELSYPEQLDVYAREKDYPGYGALYRQFVDAVRSDFPDTLDPSAAIAAQPRMMFLDWVHVTASGNDVLAREIAAAVNPR